MAAPAEGSNDGAVNVAPGPSEDAGAASKAPALVFKEQGNDHYREGRLEEALASYEAGLEAASGPSDGDLWLALSLNAAAAHLGLGQHEAGLAAAERVLAKRPGHAKAIFRAASAHVGLNNWRAAEGLLAPLTSQLVHDPLPAPEVMMLMIAAQEGKREAVLARVAEARAADADATWVTAIMIPADECGGEVPPYEIAVPAEPGAGQAFVASLLGADSKAALRGSNVARESEVSVMDCMVFFHRAGADLGLPPNLRASAVVTPVTEERGNLVALSGAAVRICGDAVVLRFESEEIAGGRRRLKPSVIDLGADDFAARWGLLEAMRVPGEEAALSVMVMPDTEWNKTLMATAMEKAIKLQGGTWVGGGSGSL